MIEKFLSRFSRKGDEDRRSEFELAMVELARESREWSAPAAVEQNVLDAVRARATNRRPVAPLAVPASRPVKSRWNLGISIPSLKWLPAGVAMAATVAAVSWVALHPAPATERLAPMAGVPLVSDSGKAIAQTEVRSDYIVLQQAVYSRAMEQGGQVVETEMPRYALAAYNLPVNPDRLDEPVKAELLLSHDGSVAAVRFVQ